MDSNTPIIHSTLEDGYDFFISDQWNKKYHFKINTFDVPSGLFSEAYEVLEINADDEPRIFHLISNYDADIEKAELQLKAKIKKGINRRYLENNDGYYSICDELEVAGRILWDDKHVNTGFDHYFQIDGKKITIEKFLNILEGFEGYNFKFRIMDTTEDID